MISPEEIKRQALKWWTQVLQSHIRNESFFPKQIDRIKRVSSAQITGHFDILQQEIENLYRFSKNISGTGYVVKTAGQNFRRTGSHELPDNIVIENIDDYLYITGRKKEWKIFLQNYNKIVSEIPLLEEWALNNTAWLTEAAVHWEDLLKVCRYFINSPRPDLYLRQLPIEIHPKFIEENASLLLSLLDHLIPGHIRNREQKKFVERFYLKYDEPLVRIRILDEQLSMPNHITDISIPLSDFERISWPVRNILIAENKMSFLTIPTLLNTIAIWSGGGFNISYLKNASWLANSNIYYWGDIDEHGFQILHQLRSYYPQVKSVLMDKDTFERFQQFSVTGQRNKSENLNLLDENEASMYRFLKSQESKNRLEQEKISQAYANGILFELLSLQCS